MQDSADRQTETADKLREEKEQRREKKSRRHRSSVLEGTLPLTEDNLKEFSNVKSSNVNMLDKINREIINEIKTKNAIFTS